MSDVIICSHYEASVLVKTKPNFYDVVYIGDPEKPFYNAYSKEIIKKAKKSFICLFNDIEKYTYGKTIPTSKMIKEILEFCEKKHDIICCSPNGISRSSAVAYVISTVNTFSPETSLKILNHDKHFPNALILQLGAEIVKKSDIVGYGERFREQVLSTIL